MHWSGRSCETSPDQSIDGGNLERESNYLIESMSSYLLFLSFFLSTYSKGDAEIWTISLSVPRFYLDQRCVKLKLTRRCGEFLLGEWRGVKVISLKIESKWKRGKKPELWSWWTRWNEEKQVRCFSQSETRTRDEWVKPKEQRGDIVHDYIISIDMYNDM